MNPLFFKLKSLWLLIEAKIKLHQTLLKRLVAGLAILFALLLIAGFLYYNFCFKKDQLIKYVPKEAILYSVIRINSETQENALLQNLANSAKQEYNLPNFDLSALNSLAGYNAALAILPASEENYYQFNYLALFDLAKRPDESVLKNSGLYWHFFQNDFLNKNILAVASSQSVIDEVVGVRNQELPSLAQQIGITMNLGAVNQKYIGKLYLNTAELAQHFQQLSDLRLKTLVSSLKLSGGDGLFLGISLKDNRILLTNAENSQANSQSLLEQTPSGYKFSLNFEQGDKKLVKILNLLARIDPDYFQKIVKNKEYSQGILNLDWQNDIMPLLADKVQVVGYSDEKYLVALKVDKIANLSQKLSKMESIIQDAFVVSEPKSEEKQLPDGTFITKILRSNSVAFQDNLVNGKNLRQLVKNDLEFGYYIDGNRLILTNSINLLVDYAQRRELVNINNCNLANIGDNLSILNPSAFLPILSGSSVFDFNEDNGKIWLCLE